MYSAPADFIVIRRRLLDLLLGEGCPGCALYLEQFIDQVACGIDFPLTAVDTYLVPTGNNPGLHPGLHLSEFAVPLATERQDLILV